MRRLATCASVRGYLNGFADGELRGDLLRGVSQHVEECESCADHVTEISQLGSILRAGVLSENDPPDLAGLADGVVSRIRAEKRESWSGLFERAVDDFYWVMVGSGAIAAALISALVVSAVVQSGVGQRSDSLAALLNTLAVAPPELGHTNIVPAGLGSRLEDDVQMASLAEVNDDGHVLSLELLSNLEKMSSLNKREAAALMTELRRMKFQQQVDRRMTDPNGRRFVWLFSTTEVRAKVL